MDHKQIFAERIKALRKQRRLSQQELGDVIGVTHKTISTIESGQYYTTIEKLIMLAKFFDVSTDYLLGLKDKP
jgi:transcriptional regulator with XRE-family HTH domain